MKKSVGLNKTGQFIPLVFCLPMVGDLLILNQTYMESLGSGHIKSNTYKSQLL